MPIECPLSVRPLTDVQFEKIDYRVMGHAFSCQNELGRLCEESAYQQDLQARLQADRFREVHIEVPVTVSFMDFAKTYSVDLVADDAVYELKTVAALNSEHQAQLLNYMFLLDVPRGKLLNFRPSKVQGQIYATRLRLADRKRVQIDMKRWQNLSNNCAVLRGIMQDLVSDWGAFLYFGLYEQALVHFCGGETEVVQRLPLRRGGVSLGTQRFFVHSPGLAFQITSVTEQIGVMESQLRRLLALTDLRAIQWINLNHSDIQFVTITT